MKNDSIKLLVLVIIGLVFIFFHNSPVYAAKDLIEGYILNENEEPISDVNFIVDVKNDETGEIVQSTTNGGKYSVIVENWNKYHIEVKYPNLTNDEIDFLSNNNNDISIAENIQKKLKYNAQDYVDGSQKKAAESIYYQEVGDAQVFLVLDTSLSMKFNNKIDKLKEKAKQIIDSLAKSNIAVGLMEFNDKANIISEPLTMTSENVQNIKDKIDNLEPNGNFTAFGNSLRIAKNYFQKVSNGNKYMIVITDGVPTDDERVEEFMYAHNAYDPDLVRQYKASHGLLYVKYESCTNLIEDLQSKNGVHICSIIIDVEDAQYNLFKEIFESCEQHMKSDDIDDQNVKIFLNNFIEIINNSVLEVKDVEYEYKENTSLGDVFNYETTKFYKAIDMNVRNDLSGFKQNAKELLRKVSKTAESESVPTRSSIRTELLMETGIVVDNTLIPNKGPDIYLKKRPEYALNATIGLTNIKLTATNGQLIKECSAKDGNVSGSENLYAIVNQEDIYGSEVSLTYVILLQNISPTTTYNDSNDKIWLLCRLPNYFTVDLEKGIKCYKYYNIDGNKSTKKFTIEEGQIKDEIEEIKRVISDDSNVQDYYKNGQCILLELDLKNNSFDLTNDKQNSLFIQIVGTKKLSNKDETFFDASVEVVGYKNDAGRRMQCKSGNINDNKLYTAVAGNYRSDAIYENEGKDYSQANTGAIIPPTGEDKSITKIYIELVIITLAMIIITIILLRNKKNYKRR